MDPSVLNFFGSPATLDPTNTKSANSVLPLAPEDEQIEKLGPTVDRVHGVGKDRADGSA